MQGSREAETRLRELMVRKTDLESQISWLRLWRQRAQRGYGPRPPTSAQDLEAALRKANRESQALDQSIAPLAKASGESGNPTWGLLMRAGNDKSLFARQVERYADVYTSRVSNFLAETPFAYLRAARGTLPHDD